MFSTVSKGPLPQWPHFETPADVLKKLSPEGPVLCFSQGVLEEKTQEFMLGFGGRVSYAVKANNHRQVLEVLFKGGVTVFDVASISEIQTITSLFPGARLHYHNPVKSRREISDAFEIFGCRRFAIDHINELDKLSDLIKDRGDVEIAVRFQVSKSEQCAHDFSFKFGAPPDVCQVLLRQVRARGFSPVLTFHPGSQCQAPDVYRDHIFLAAHILKEAEVAVPVLNIGGGFPAQYRQGNIPPHGLFFSEITRAAQDAFHGNPPLLECEPGRGLVADCMSLLARVTLVKPEGQEIYLNDGVYGALMEMYQIPSLTPRSRVWRNGIEVTGETSEYVAFGPTCDPMDRLPGRLALPKSLQEGDYIEFLTLGAYGDATTTNFNGYGTHQLVRVDHF